MKHITLFLLFLLLSCKSESNTESLAEEAIDSSVYEMWDRFTESHPEFKNSEIPESWFFHNNKEDANRLAQLVIDGKKKASSGLYVWYEEAQVDLPKIGTKSIITDFDGKAQAIIEIRSVDTIPFYKISKEYAALDMGTEMEPLSTWKKAHWDFFAKALKENGQEPTKEMLIVCERFETLWIKKY